MGESESSALEKGQSGLLRAALLGCCPQCGAKTLFEAPARVAFKCGACELDFAPLERGGRFAGLLTVIFAIVLMMIALAIENAFRPPLWLQMAFWAPVTVFGVIFGLRLFKTVMLYANYERGQEEQQ